MATGPAAAAAVGELEEEASIISEPSTPKPFDRGDTIVDTKFGPMTFREKVRMDVGWKPVGEPATDRWVEARLKMDRPIEELILADNWPVASIWIPPPSPPPPPHEPQYDRGTKKHVDKFRKMRIQLELRKRARAYDPEFVEELDNTPDPDTQLVRGRPQNPKPPPEFKFDPLSRKIDMAWKRFIIKFKAMRGLKQKKSVRKGVLRIFRPEDA